MVSLKKWIEIAQVAIGDLKRLGNTLTNTKLPTTRRQKRQN